MNLPLIEDQCTLLSSTTHTNRLIRSGSNCESNGEPKSLADFPATQAAQRLSARTKSFAKYNFVQIAKKLISKLSVSWATQVAQHLSVRTKTFAKRCPVTIVEKFISKPLTSWYAKRLSTRLSRALHTVIRGSSKGKSPKFWPSNAAATTSTFRAVVATEKKSWLQVHTVTRSITRQWTGQFYR